MAEPFHAEETSHMEKDRPVQALAELSKWGPWAVGALLLMGLVGLGARKLPGSGSTREPVVIEFDIAQAVTNFFITSAALIVLVMLVLIFWPGQDPLDLPKRSMVKYALGPLVIIGLVLLLAVFTQQDRDAAAGPVETATLPAQAIEPPPESGSSLGFVALVGAIGVALLAIGLRAQRRPESEAVSDSSDDGAFDTQSFLALPDRALEGDEPRAQVIRAYADMIDTFASRQLPLRAAETAREFVTRAVVAVEAAADPARHLTGLFELARFSQHRLDEADVRQAQAAAGAVKKAVAASV